MQKKILLIEDDQVFADNLKKEFNSEDEQVIHVSDGEEGLRLAQEELPDVIILDVIIPKRLGLSVLESLKNDERTKFIPVVVVSSFGGEVNEKRALQLGAIKFIMKAHLTLRELAQTVRMYYPAVA